MGRIESCLRIIAVSALSIMIIPALLSIAVVLAVASVLVFVYAAAGTFFHLSPLISVGGLNYDGINQLLLAVPGCLLLWLIAAFCLYAFKKCVPYLTNLLKGGEIAAKAPQNAKAPRRGFSIIEIAITQTPIMIKIVMIAIPVLILLILIITVIFAVFDNVRIDNYFSNTLFQKAIAVDCARIWVVSGLSSYAKLALWSGAATGLFIITRAIAILWKRKNRMMRIRRFFLFLANISFLGFMLIAVVNLMFVSYVNRIMVSSGDGFPLEASYVQKIEYIREQIEDENLSVNLALNRIMADITASSDFFHNMRYQERVSLCEEINKLIGQKEGPSNIEEHYFRNYLNAAPDSLDGMLREIANPRGAKWVLMEPGQSAYHMYGKDGEFNVKFITDDGLFEAVYNKSGVLLTEKNDAVNMGTYNYASPVSDPEKHIIYDILPYSIWGNVMFGRSYADEDALDNLEKFTANESAVEHYDTLRQRIANLVSEASE